MGCAPVKKAEANKNQDKNDKKGKSKYNLIII